MDNNSRETLRRVAQNDPSLAELRLGDNNNNYDYGVNCCKCHSGNSGDYSTLGTAIANNTHLETLRVTLSDDLPLGVTDREFYDGIKSNTSINTLCLSCNYITIAGGVAHEILKMYQENNSHLAKIIIGHAIVQNGGDDRVIGNTLRCCRNLQRVVLNYCNITDAQLLTIVDALRRHRMLEDLNLTVNNIGNAGCYAIATLLADPDCNLRHLSLRNNTINNEGATAIANSLTNNNKLQCLYLDHNQIDRSVEDIFSNVLCNTTSINDTYSSNHTLQSLLLPHDHGQHLPMNLPMTQNLQSLLSLNRINNKSHVAMKKILKHHPNIDMEPLFEWGEGKEDEGTLKALPYVVDWFEKAKVAVAEGDETYHIEEKKLSAIFQFAKAMPLLLEGIARYGTHESGGSGNKRKRTEG